jgi:thiol:disulfide interchange protein
MKNLILIIGLLLGQFANAQIIEPIKWSTEVIKLADNEYKLISTAALEPGWHLYSQNVPEDGPIPTSFIYNNDENNFRLIGETIEEAGSIVEDPVFMMEIKYFENTVVFEQRIQLLVAQTKIDAIVEFMVCDDSRCLPPTEVDLIFNLPKNEKVVLQKTDKQLIFVDTLKENQIDEEGDKLILQSTEDEKIDGDNNSLQPLISDVLQKEEFTATEAKKGLWAIFIIAFLSGFAALLTPCVFPMIPLTVSYFTKKSKTKANGIKNSIIYGLSIILIYVLLGTTVTAIFGADSLNALATSVWFNIVFFLILVIFAFSFLGAFEIMLPNSWANKVDSQADKGGIIGIFFMALALAIVSFSCTGPIVGTLLVEAASKGGLAPIIGMLGFSLAIALPFALFAAFPGWLNSLPKSGGWLNTVKVVLGFLELALAFKFLSQADLVLQLHLLEREVFLVIWIAIFGTMTLYLFGKIKLPHDSQLTHISVGRLSLGLVAFSLTIYMVPGLWGAPLNLISAFPPPQAYSESPYGVGFSKQGSLSEVLNHSENLPEGAHLLAPHDILSFNDYDIGLAYAKKVGKPVMIDFTGWACVNCRKMEQNVWPKPNVLSTLKNDVILISLYVDDKRPLEIHEITESKLKPGRQLKYIGQKWSELQAINYKSNSQPFYVLMNHNEENLVPPIGYMPNADDYYNWLQTGIKKFY